MKVGIKVHSSVLKEFPIWIDEKSRICVRDRNGKETCYKPEPGLGLICLMPLPEECLELCMWGCDLDGLRGAARLLPLLPGVGQPDFVVVNRSCGWKGAAGAYSMGFFDSSWNLSESSLVK